MSYFCLDVLHIVHMVPLMLQELLPTVAMLGCVQTWSWIHNFISYYLAIYFHTKLQWHHITLRMTLTLYILLNCTKWVYPVLSVSRYFCVSHQTILHWYKITQVSLANHVIFEPKAPLNYFLMSNNIQKVTGKMIIGILWLSEILGWY